MKSEYVCRRCGLRVYQWYGHGHKDKPIWKHAANLHTKSCGKAPDLVLKRELEKEQVDFNKGHSQ
jgi:hypothetical protein